MEFSELKTALANNIPLIWNDPQPIEGADYTITQIEDLTPYNGLDAEMYKDLILLIQYDNSEAQVFLTEIEYKDPLLNVAEVYINTSFKECVMYCTDSNLISREYEKEVIKQYNENEEFESDIVSSFFDEIGLNEDLFIKYSNYIEVNKLGQ